MFEEMAKERMVEGKNQFSPVANSPQAENNKSRAQAAKAVNVGERIVQDAQFVRDHDQEAGRAAVFWLLWEIDKGMSTLLFLVC